MRFEMSRSEYWWLSLDTEMYVYLHTIMEEDPEDGGSAKGKGTASGM